MLNTVARLDGERSNPLSTFLVAVCARSLEIHQRAELELSIAGKCFHFNRYCASFGPKIRSWHMPAPILYSFL